MEAFNEEIKRIETITRYRADDGTVFNDRAECEKYENTARCTIKTKFDKLIINRNYDAWTLLGGNDDTTVLVVKMKDKKDMDTVLQMLFIENPYLQKSENADTRKAYADKIESAFKDNGILLWAENYDGDYYFIDSRCSIIEKLTGLDKE